MANLFERLSEGRPAQEPDPKPTPSAAQKLLDWLQRWDKPTVCVRDIRIYGPGSLRNQKKATDSAQVLVKNGWLTPVQTRQGHRWQIVRKPIAHPTVAAE